MYPPDPIIPAYSGDTDNSWTTESSVSVTNSSRESSPLDTLLEVPKSDSQQTVTADTGAENSSRESSPLDPLLEVPKSDLQQTVTTDTCAGLNDHGEQEFTNDAADNISGKSENGNTETGNDVQSQTNTQTDTDDTNVEDPVSDSEQKEDSYIEENEFMTDNISMPSAKGAACEQETTGDVDDKS